MQQMEHPGKSSTLDTVVQGQIRAAGGTHNDCQGMNKSIDNQQSEGFIVDSQSAVLSNLVGEKVDNMNDLAWGLEQ